MSFVTLPEKTADWLDSNAGKIKEISLEKNEMMVHRASCSLSV